MTRCLLAATPTVAVGCSVADDYPETHAVGGVVTLDGSPVGSADVVFHPNSLGQSAVAVTRADGRFETQTAFEMGRVYRPGLVAGSYAVTIEKRNVQEAYNSGTRPPNLLPARYADRAMSNFSIEVSSSGPSEFVFKLTSD